MTFQTSIRANGDLSLKVTLLDYAKKSVACASHVSHSCGPNSRMRCGMNIGVDGSVLGATETGVALTTRRLLSAFAAAYPSHRLTLFAHRVGLSPELRANRVINGCLIGPRPRTFSRALWEQLVLPWRLWARDVDLLYCPCYTKPLLTKVPTIVTVHDMIAWKWPTMCRVRNLARFRAFVGMSVRQARCVTVPTEAVRQDLLKILRPAQGKVVVLPWGPGNEICPTSKSDAHDVVQRDFGISERYVLFIGNVEPKKNLGTLIRAANRINAMVIAAGPCTWGRRHVKNTQRAQGGQRCRFLGYVSPQQLGALYVAADCLAFPSYIEGFGLPPLEAMNYGTPVLASDIPALREVCGKAALFVPPHDEAAIADGLVQLRKDHSLRNELIGRGFEQSRRFTWAQSARIFAETLDRLACS